MRVPTSVLLAVLAAAGLLALAPALVRRYDATERLVAERALSTARVLSRADRRRRTVPGRRPVNPPRLLVPRVSSAPGPLPPPRRNLTPVPPSARRRVHRAPRAMYRRRRVLLALVLLNMAELCGIMLVSPGFWVSFAVTGALLVAYLAHLRTRALRDRRRRREEARYAAWIVRRQAQVRREQLRRAAARREALAQQLAERDRARREAARLNALRGRPYDTRASGQ
ncbi:divisome protein SepX/GlpR [Dactylosporangium sp. CA-233914]|uniref:divisome protein SepX/GlpR n=1 Tax=Dactylosporangium sp. CA-233914 TaxID=3239934 RepID=UPI003D8FA2F9